MFYSRLVAEDVLPWLGVIGPNYRTQSWANPVARQTHKYLCVFGKFNPVYFQNLAIDI
jgi:hypothetical protein